MKRGILVLLFILLLACSVNAMTVTLGSLSSPITDPTFPISISCEVGGINPDIETLSNLTLYLRSNITNPAEPGYMEWQNKGFVDDMPNGGTKVFSVSGLVNATYEWNCLAVSNNSEEKWAIPNNGTFIITFITAAAPTNNPPTWQQSTNKSTTEDSGTTLVVNLDYDSSDTENDAASTTFLILYYPNLALA